MTETDTELIHRFSTELGLNPDQLSLLIVMLDPANDPSQSATNAQDMLDGLTTFSGTDATEARTVAERLREHHNRGQGRTGAFEFEFVYDYGESAPDSANVLTAIGEAGTWLTVVEDSKYFFADRYDLKGVAAAIKLAENIADEYKRLMAMAARVVMVDPPGPPTPLSELPDGHYFDAKSRTWTKDGESWIGHLEDGEELADAPKKPAAHGLLRVQLVRSPVNAVEDD